jgi:molybdenum cofactor biosynthesis enzyme MoaA
MIELRLVITAKCNFNCIFCLNEFTGPNMVSRNKFKMKLSDYESFFMNFDNIENKIEKITITGGEPFVESELLNIVKVIKSRCNIHLTVVTNGAYIDKKLDVLKYIDELHISHHSFTFSNWRKLVHVDDKDMFNKVISNITLARVTNAFIPIKINIVADEDNQNEMFEYLKFAKKWNLILNVFQEGFDQFRKLANLLNSKNTYRKKSKFWSLYGVKSKLIKETKYKKTFNIDGVELILSFTSTDKKRWKSVWISPEGLVFCDIEHRTLEPYIQSYNFGKVNEIFDSMQLELDSYNSHKANINEINIFRKQHFEIDNMIKFVESVSV